MIDVKRVATIAGTFGVALGLGFLVQNGDALASRDAYIVVENNLTPVESTLFDVDENGDIVFRVQSVVTTPLPHSQNVRSVAAVNNDYADVNPPGMGAIYATPFGDCAATLVATPRVAATVQLDLSAPCHDGASFLVRHDGIIFSGRTNSAGGATVEVPALSKDANFTVTFDNIEVASATVRVTDVEEYDRAILQWRGTNNLQLHALEFGATFGDPGHIWSASANRVDLAPAGQRGFMVRLGDSAADIPFLAEVYTFPSGMTNRDGEISIQVGAAITQQNCGRILHAQSIQTNTGRLLITRDLEIPIPSCDRIGQSLMLPDMFQDVSLALR